MARYFSFNTSEICALEPSAGNGSLVLRFIRSINAYNKGNNNLPKIKLINFDIYEIDDSLIRKLKHNLAYCRSLCAKNNIGLTYKIYNEDFTSSKANNTIDFDNLPIEKKYSHIILNPPYKNTSVKLQSSISDEVCDKNLYTIFINICIKYLLPCGQLVGLIPRMCLTEKKFEHFRSNLLEFCKIKAIHYFTNFEIYGHSQYSCSTESIILNLIMKSNKNSNVLLTDGIINNKIQFSSCKSLIIRGFEDFCVGNYPESYFLENGKIVWALCTVPHFNTSETPYYTHNTLTNLISFEELIEGVFNIDVYHNADSPNVSKTPSTTFNKEALLMCSRNLNRNSLTPNSSKEEKKRKYHLDKPSNVYIKTNEKKQQYPRIEEASDEYIYLLLQYTSGNNMALRRLKANVFRVDIKENTNKYVYFDSSLVVLKANINSKNGKNVTNFIYGLAAYFNSGLCDEIARCCLSSNHFSNNDVYGLKYPSLDILNKLGDKIIPMLKNNNSISYNDI